MRLEEASSTKQRFPRCAGKVMPPRSTSHRLWHAMDREPIAWRCSHGRLQFSVRRWEPAVGPICSIPPSTGQDTPVTYDAAGEHRNATTAAGTAASVENEIRRTWSMRRRSHRVPALRSSFAGSLPSGCDHADGFTGSCATGSSTVTRRSCERSVALMLNTSPLSMGAAVHPLLIDAARPSGKRSA